MHVVRGYHVDVWYDGEGVGAGLPGRVAAQILGVPGTYHHFVISDVYAYTFHRMFHQPLTH